MERHGTTMLVLDKMPCGWSFQDNSGLSMALPVSPETWHYSGFRAAVVECESRSRR